MSKFTKWVMLMTETSISDHKTWLTHMHTKPHFVSLQGGQQWLVGIRILPPPQFGGVGGRDRWAARRSPISPCPTSSPAAAVLGPKAGQERSLAAPKSDWHVCDAAEIKLKCRWSESHKWFKYALITFKLDEVEECDQGTVCVVQGAQVRLWLRHVN